MPYSDERGQHSHSHSSNRGELVSSLLPVHIVHTADTLSTAMAHAVMEHITRMAHESSPANAPINTSTPTNAPINTNSPTNSTDSRIVVHQCIRDHDFFQHITHIATSIANPSVSGSIIAIDMHGIQGFHAAVAVSGIVSAQCYDEFTSQMTRAHNDAKCITLASSILSPSLGSRIAELFLTTEFEGGRHADRLRLLHGIRSDATATAALAETTTATATSAETTTATAISAETTTATTLIAIGCDHSALQHKNEIKAYIEGMTVPGSSSHVCKVVDVGTNTTESVHYPNYGESVGRLVASGEVHLGIVICGTGVGIVNAASKVDGVRSTLALHPSTAYISQSMYNCNVLAIGARTTGVGVALELVESFVTSWHQYRLSH